VNEHFPVQPGRVHRLSAGVFGPGPVVYWMSRDQRAADNWALIHTQRQALAMRRPVVVIFCLVDSFLGASGNHFAFMLAGLHETAASLRRRNITFLCVRGDPPAAVPRAVSRMAAAMLVTDFDPLRIKRRWRGAVASALSIPVYEVDARNIVPCRAVSDKREYGAYTLRPRLMRALPEHLIEMPVLDRHPFPLIAVNRGIRALAREASLPAVPRARFPVEPGTQAGIRRLRQFIRRKLAAYPQAHNDPARDGQSGLSPYLHFGQLSAQRVALEVHRADVPRAAREAFLEQLIVRRELSDNFCEHTPGYDTIAAAPSWAQETLRKHARDRRTYRYTLHQLEHAETHDALWNAAQREMVLTGKMHGYLRMYWAKKILEWSRDPADAYAAAVYLNDRYEYDGRDSNGYAGIAWAITGVHDRPWMERPVFGTVRYMSAAGCARKFDVEAYIRRISRL